MLKSDIRYGKIRDLVIRATYMELHKLNEK